MRQRRIERGALTLASAEVKFQIDTETHDPLDIGTLMFVLIFFFLYINFDEARWTVKLDVQSNFNIYTVYI